ncbi:hypothetical protein [Georgenia sp. AZ-5]|uniref:hypothetical protein n=1 Tax=Georgenia sp. AZ-5 TaxID=3367526 RepID=UPI0037541947
MHDKPAAQAEREEARAGVTREAGRDGYDSAQRREALAADLERRGVDQETIAARMTADISRGKHPSEAVKSAGKKAPRARRSRETNQRQHELSR